MEPRMPREVAVPRMSLSMQLRDGQFVAPAKAGAQGKRLKSLGSRLRERRTDRLGAPALI